MLTNQPPSIDVCPTFRHPAGQMLNVPLGHIDSNIDISRCGDNTIVLHISAVRSWPRYATLSSPPGDVLPGAALSCLCQTCLMLPVSWIPVTSDMLLFII